jgi:hypothetical protein
MNLMRKLGVRGGAELRWALSLLGAFVLRTLHVENTLLGLAFGYARVSMLLGTLGNAHVACFEYVLR